MQFLINAGIRELFILIEHQINAKVSDRRLIEVDPGIFAVCDVKGRSKDTYSCSPIPQWNVCRMS